MNKFVASVAVAATLATSTACDSFGQAMSAHKDVLARAAGHELSIDQASALFAGNPRIPAQPDVVNAIANLASQKLHLYRRLSRIEQVGEVHALAAEVRDRYGPPPVEVERLISAAALRLLGTRLGVERITMQREAARVTFRDGVVVRLANLQTALRSHQVELEIKRTSPLSFILRRRGGAGIFEIVASALEGLVHSQTPVSAVL